MENVVYGIGMHVIVILVMPLFQKQLHTSDSPKLNFWQISLIFEVSEQNFWENYLKCRITKTTIEKD